MEAHCASWTASPSVHGRAPTCEPRPTNEQLICVRVQVTKRKPRALSLSGGSAARAPATCARRPRWVESVYTPWTPLRQRNVPFARCTAVLRHATRGLQRAAYLRMCARKKAPLRSHSLSLEEAQHARLRHARAAPRWLELSIPYGSPLRQFHGHPPRCTAVLRHASCGLQRAAYLRMCAR